MTRIQRPEKASIVLQSRSIIRRGGRRLSRFSLLTTLGLLFLVVAIWVTREKDNLYNYNTFLLSLSRPLDQPQLAVPLQQQQPQQQQQTQLPHRKWAYAFLIGGCDPAYPSHYRGMLYNILVAAHILKTSGSRADVVVMVQLSIHTTTTGSTTLPVQDVRALKALNIHIHYLPPPVGKVQNMYTVFLDKAQILGLVQYSRVMFLDGDILPLCNLDYLFHLSEPPATLPATTTINGGAQPTQPKPLLKENVLHTEFGEAMNAGLFILRPAPGELQDIQRIIVERERHFLQLGKFDVHSGWGHVIQPPDKWRGYEFPEGRVYEGTEWTYYSAIADQGLLYYWAKYYKQSVSLIIKDQVENWGTGNTDNGETGTGTLRLEETLIRPLENYTCLPKGMDEPGKFGLNNRRYKGQVPYQDFVHFYGTANKPWEQPAPPDVASRDDANSPLQYWYHVLRKVKREHGILMTVDIEHLSTTSGKQPLGYRISEQNLMDAVKARHGVGGK
jgi:hypothetical protein